MGCSAGTHAQEGPQAAKAGSRGREEPRGWEGSREAVGQSGWCEAQEPTGASPWAWEQEGVVGAVPRPPPGSSGPTCRPRRLAWGTDSPSHARPLPRAAPAFPETPQHREGGLLPGALA